MLLLPANETPNERLPTMSTTTSAPAPRYSPIPLVNRLLAEIWSATTTAGLWQIATKNAARGSEFQTLVVQDQHTVRQAFRHKRLTVTWREIWSGVTRAMALADRPIEIGDSSPVVPRGWDRIEGNTPTAPATAPTTAPVDLASLQASTDLTARTMPTNPARGRRARNAQEIAEATALARANGAKLAGYDGQAIEPATGSIGTIVAFGYAQTEYDVVSGRDRQILISWGTIEAIRVKHDLPEGAFGRSPGNVGMLGAATQILNHGGYVARSCGRGKWKVGHFDNRLDSESLGRKEALIQLDKDGRIQCDNPDHPGARSVIADYERRVAGTMVASDVVKTRIEDCLRRHYGARSTELGLYVSPSNAARAVDLVVSLRPVAGRRIYAYAHTDAASISDALTDSLAADLARLESDVAKGCSVPLVARLERLRTECNALTSLLGSDVTERYKARLNACDATLVKGLSEGSQRAMMLDMD